MMDKNMATVENKDVEQAKQPPEPTVKKSVKEEKNRKKDDKSVEQVLKALNSLETTEEKLAAMCKKYTDIVDENRKLQLAAKQTEKRLSMVQREKEQLQTEHSKAVLTRSRLESLCRELQRQNKAIKDESLLKIREEEEKRKEVSAKFQSTLNEITALMQQNNEKNSKLREDNIEMKKKFKTYCEQNELREQQIEKITKQKQLEAQLADAKLAKAKMEMAAEKEALLKEKQQLLVDLTEYQSKCQDLQATEMNLRGQIHLYTDKYDEFQNALSRSNEVFGGFKGEMERMSKKICKLEKETSSWKQRWEKSHQALLDMAADKQQRDGELALATRQLAQLQKLCRTLQAERTSLLAQLRTESAGKEGGATAKDSSYEILQPAQEMVSCPMKMAVNSEPCRHELGKDTIATQTQTESCHTKENTLSNLIPNINPQVQATSGKPSENISVETPSTKITKEDISPAAPLEPKIEGESCMNDTSHDKPDIQLISQISGEDILLDKKLPVNDNDTSVKIENQCTNPIQENASEETRTDVNSNQPPTNLQNSNQSLNQVCFMEGMIAGYETLLAETFLENKNITVINAPANEVNHITANGIPQEPVKSSPTDKKGKEGAKKRKNK